MNELPKKCENCKAENPVSALFCQHCGTSLDVHKQVDPPPIMQKCRLCGAENQATAIHCLTCGVKLSEAKLGVTETRLREWEQHFQQYAFYQKIWESKIGWGWKIHERSRELRKSKYSNIYWSASNFAIPIAAKDWCVDYVEMEGEKIGMGEIIWSDIAMLIIDTRRERIHQFEYANINQVTLQEGWKFLITLKNAKTLNFHIKTPGSASTLFSLVSDVSYRWSTNSAMEREASLRSTQRTLDERKDKYDVGRSFWGSILNFFKEIFER